MGTSSRKSRADRAHAAAGAAPEHDRGARRTWDWDGGEILGDCIVPSCRPSAAGGTYDTDVRSFLQVGHNAVVDRCAEREILASFDPGVARRRARASSVSSSPIRPRGPGSFDLRAAAVLSWVTEHVRYLPSGRGRAASDPWQLPDETLARKAGDCEDRAFLIASLLAASGISEFNLRVALGQVVLDDGGPEPARKGHAWVVYKTEAGHWTILEPTLPPSHERSLLGGRRSRGPDVRYVPFFLFNQRHLWRVRETWAELERLVGSAAARTDRPSSRGGRPAGKASTIGAWREWRRSWARVEPSFAGRIHASVIHTALDGVAHPTILAAIEMGFRNVFGQVVDDVDFRMGDYDPRDHFDSGYILSGWDWARWRLDQFRVDPFRRAQYFAYAAHAIADFYSHTSWPHFADRDGAGNIRSLYDPTRPLGGLATSPTYDAASGFDLDRFTVHRNWDRTTSRAGTWNGKIVSGRYAFNRDTWPGIKNAVTEGLTYVPGDLVSAPDFWKRLGLPHHNEIAVDAPQRESSHILYGDDEYGRQFDARCDAAIRHVRDAYTTSGGPPP